MISPSLPPSRTFLENAPPSFPLKVGRLFPFWFARASFKDIPLCTSTSVKVPRNVLASGQCPPFSTMRHFVSTFFSSPVFFFPYSCAEFDAFSSSSSLYLPFVFFSLLDLMRSLDFRSPLQYPLPPPIFPGDSAWFCSFDCGINDLFLAVSSYCVWQLPKTRV